MYTGKIDWAVLEKYDKSTCYCFCEAVFESHAKGISLGDKFVMVSQQPCPACGQNDKLRRISSPPEEWRIRG